MEIEVSPPLERQDVPCLMCRSARREPLPAGPSGVVRCLECGFAYTSPRLTPESLEQLYSHQYFESTSSQALGYDDYVADRPLIERTFAERLAELERRFLPQPGRLLDVGCATGFFLSVAQARGWQVEGVEISEWAAAHARRELGVEVRRGAFCHVGDLQPGLDLVTMWDYIEHSTVPDRDIEAAHQLLRPGGVLALTTPDLGSLPARVFGSRWMGFKEHEHLYYFTRKNLGRLLERKGFRVVVTRHVGKYISLGFLGKRTKMYSTAAGAAVDRVSRWLGLTERSLYVNPFDIVLVVAIK